MPIRRAPWWMFVIAASFVVHFAVFTHLSFRGPRSLGIGIEFTGGRMIVQSVDPQSSGGRVGLRVGDWIVAADGQLIHEHTDWLAIRANLEVGRSSTLEIERSGRRLQQVVTAERISWSGRQPASRFNLLLNKAGQLVMLLLAFLIVFNRPRDLVARLGALLLATVAITQGAPPYGSAATLRNLPALVGGLVWIAAALGFMLPQILFAFCVTFPRKLFQARWIWFVLLTPGFAATMVVLHYGYRIVYQPERLTGYFPDPILRVIVTLGLIYMVGGLLALIVNYAKLQDVNERRRVRVLVAGSIVGWLAALPWMFMIVPGFVYGNLIPIFLSVPYRLVSNVLYYVLFPISFAYAILRHRVFDIRVIVRQGLQYALARRFLLSLAPAFGVTLVLDIFFHGDQPLLSILRERGWIYLALGGLAVSAHARQQVWMESLDRRFFRERYDAQRLLREVAEEVRQAQSFEGVASRVVARIEEAFHPEFASLLVREGGQTAYRPLATAPAGQAPAPLPAESKVISLLQLLGRPLELSTTESGWLKDQLPNEDTDFLRLGRIDLLVPITAGGDGREALMALGRKRSEEPYSREDKDLLVAIASSLALLRARPVPARTRVSKTFEECPQCGACYDAGAAYCSEEGSALTTTMVPRMVGERYRLDRRLGRGGMGTVYSATDTALERRIALKVIRDDRVGTAEAAGRFRREARASASFAHPNVVTVHDYGVIGDTRAYLVMELLHGVTLREELKINKRLPAGRALKIFRGICSAVDAAHRRQLVHRDLKPENIFLARQANGEVPKVLDFGIAKILDSATQVTTDTEPGAIVGTLYYMPAEQMRGEAPIPAWDLWALAVMAYEALSGSHPFASRNAADLQMAVLMGRFTPITEHIPEAPAGWEDFFARALSHQADRRPSSASSFLTELERALA